MRVAWEGDGEGQRGGVARKREDGDPERGGAAAVPLRADAEAVGLLEQLLLERIERRIRVGRAELANEGLLAEDRRLLEGATDADTQDQRRAGIGTGRAHALDDPVLDALDARGGREH